MADVYPDNNYVLYTTPYKTPVSEVEHLGNATIKQPKGIWRTLHSTWRSLRITKEIIKDKIDIYHGLSHELPVGIEKAEVKSVVTMHDLIVLRYPHLYKPIDRKIYMKKYRAACKHADLIVAISRQTKEDLINLMGIDESKIRLVYQGCDPQFYTLHGETEKNTVKQKYNLPDKYILNVGTIEERKSLAVIVRALAKLPADVHLVAVGKPTDYMQKVQTEIERYKQQNHVLFYHNA